MRWLRSDVTKTGSHVRDGIDLKRMMITVVIALVPLAAMGMYNTGYQAFLAMASGGAAPDTWQMAVYSTIGPAADFNNPSAHSDGVIRSPRSLLRQSSMISSAIRAAEHGWAGFLGGYGSVKPSSSALW